jgi:hypothetical protein
MERFVAASETILGNVRDDKTENPSFRKMMNRNQLSCFYSVCHFSVGIPPPFRRENHTDIEDIDGENATVFKIHCVIKIVTNWHLICLKGAQYGLRKEVDYGLYITGSLVNRPREIFQRTMRFY